MNSSLVIILINSVPLIGMLFFDWSVYSILIYYLLETVALNLYGLISEFVLIVLKSKKIRKKLTFDLYTTFIMCVLIFPLNWLIILVLIFYYYKDRSIQTNFLVASFICFLVIYGIKTLVNIVNYRKSLLVENNDEFSMAMRRTVILVLTLCFGGYFVEYFHLPTATIVFMVIIKSYIEVSNMRVDRKE